MSRFHAARTWAARLGVVGLAVVGVQIAATEIASAHAVAVRPSATCLQDGQYQVTWTVTNDWTTSADVTVTSPTPASSSLDRTAVTLQPKGTGAVVQSAIPAGTRTASITTTSVWPSDNVTSGPSTTTVDLSGVCPKPQHTATAPSVGNGACVAGRITLPSITIPADQGVDYTLDSKPVDRGTYTVKPGKHTVQAASSTLKLVGSTTWSYQLRSAPGDCTTVTPVPPRVTQSACAGATPTAPQLSLPSTTAITYLVSRSGPYHPGETVTVTAVAAAGHTFGASLPSGWHRVNETTARTTVRFAPSATCTRSVGAVQPVFTSAACTPGSAVTTPGSYTVPSVKGVAYVVNGKPAKAGTYTAPWGSTVSVAARALTGYTLRGTATWQATFPSQQQCADQAGVTASHTPDTSGSGSAGAPTLANTGVETTPLLVGGIAAIVLGALLTVLASRRRKDPSA